MDAVNGQLIPALPACRNLPFFQTKIWTLWAPIFFKTNSKTLLRIYIYSVTILYRNKMHKLKLKEELTSHAEIDHFWIEIRPLWAPIFENQNSKTLLRIYIYYVTILYRNKMHKLISERGVDVTCRNWPFSDRNSTPVGPYFWKSKF